MASSSESAAPLFPHERGPGKQALERLQPCVTGMAAYVRRRIRNLMNRTGDSGSEALRAIGLLMEEMRSASYEDASQLLGILDAMRHSKISPEALKDIGMLGALSPNIASMLEKLSSFQRQWYAGQETDVVIDAIEAMRLSSPFGINMVNPRFDEQVPSSISAAAFCLLQLPSNDPDRNAYVSPVNSFLSCIAYKYSRSLPNGERMWKDQSHLLRNGEAALLGRGLTVTRLFEQPLGDAALTVPVACNVRSGSISRGGILIARQDDQLFLFDRGTKNKLTILLSDVPFVTYTAESVDTGESWSFGSSQLLSEDDDSEPPSDEPSET